MRQANKPDFNPVRTKELVFLRKTDAGVNRLQCLPVAGACSNISVLALTCPVFYR
jgi:hypothetical protein